MSLAASLPVTAVRAVINELETLGAVTAVADVTCIIIFNFNFKLNDSVDKSGLVALVNIVTELKSNALILLDSCNYLSNAALKLQQQSESRLGACQVVAAVAGT